jgi:hypothetical protein
VIVCSISYPACKAHAPVLSSVACLALPYSSTLSHERHDFLKKKNVTEHETFVLIFSTNMSEIYLIRRIIQRDIIINVHRSSLKYSFLMSYFNKTNFLDRFSKNTHISNSMKIRRVGSELLHIDGRMDGQTERQIDGRADRHDEANSRFSPFCEHA